MLERWMTHENTKWCMATKDFLKLGAEFSTKECFKKQHSERTLLNGFGAQGIKCYILKIQWEMLILILTRSFNCHI